MIDGIHFGGQVLVVALGIAESGEKHALDLGVWQGATENTAVVKGLLEDLVDRGLDLQRRYLVVIDGSKALRAGVERVFGAQVEVQRCQIHKRRNVKGVSAGELPEGLRPTDAQRVCDEQLRGGQSGVGENLPATGTDQSERGKKPRGGAGRDADRPSLGYRSGIAAKTGDHQPDRIVFVDGATRGAERKALARRKSTATLDSYRAPGGGEKVPTHQRLSRTLAAEGTLESFGHSAEGGPDRRSCLNFDDPSCAVVWPSAALRATSTSKTGDAIGRARWESSLLGNPGAKFSRGKQKSAQEKKKGHF